MNKIRCKTRTIISLCLILFAVVANAQSITGNVTDESGVPLPGANVVIEGTSTGVSTDFDGKFLLEDGKFLFYIPFYRFCRTSHEYACILFTSI